MVYLICNNYFLNTYIEKKLKGKIEVKKVYLKNYKNYFMKLLKKIVMLIYGINPFLNISSLENIKIKETDIVIFFDIINSRMLKEIIKLFPCSKKIFWIWNTIGKKQENDINYLKKLSKNVWTFDKKDAEKYGLKFREQFHFIDINNRMVEEKDSLFFIGVDKGRLGKIKNIDEIFKKFFGIESKILLKKDLFKLYRKDEKKYFINELLSYENVCNEIQKSKYILDIVKNGQTGLTLRVLEALFYQKKLITNNKEIEKYDFYNPNNIFIIDDMNNISSEKIKKIDKFLKLNYEEVDKNIMKKYTIEAWLDTILEEVK